MNGMKSNQGAQYEISVDGVPRTYRDRQDIAVATLATWGMTLVIQRAEHRDTQTIHAKLDEILHALGDARNEITRMDEKEPEEIERRREHMRKDD